jgi:Uma2 family endonuclease
MPLLGLHHGRIVAQISAALGPFVWDHDLGEVFGRCGYQLTWSPDTVLGPDISFISKGRLEATEEREGYWQGPPDLAVEVSSPGDGSDELKQKASRWLNFGTKQDWIVDLDHSAVTVYRSESITTMFYGSD